MNDLDTGKTEIVFYGKGLLLKQQVQDAQGRTYRETQRTYEFYDIKAHAVRTLESLIGSVATIFPQQVKSEQCHFEPETSGSAVKKTHTTHKYDEVGNVTEFFDARDEADTDTQDDVKAIIAYTTQDISDNNVACPHKKNDTLCASFAGNSSVFQSCKSRLRIQSFFWRYQSNRCNFRFLGVNLGGILPNC